jgi:signal peptidase I
MEPARRSNSALALSALAIPLFALGACGRSTYSVASTSMAPSLDEGEIVLAQAPKNACKGVRPTIGDVVVSWESDGPPFFIKRVVAGPGSTVQMRGGRLFVDGVGAQMQDVGPIDPKFAATQKLAGPHSRVLRETLSNGASHLIIDLTPNGEGDDTPEFKVPEDSWFLMGDNRDNTDDSRYVGPIPTRHICGVVDKIFWSWRFDRIGKRP